MDFLFFPGAISSGDAARPGTQRVDLEAVLFVLRATFEHPVTRGRVTLPPHFYFFFNPLDPRGRTTRSKRSDDAGRAIITLKAGLFDNPTEPWVLTPVPLRAEDRDGIAEHREMWIDLEENVWIPPAKVRAQTAEGVEIRKKKLIRLPFYSSTDKAVRGRHFDGPSTEFRDTGVVFFDTKPEPYGTLDEPWEYHVDHRFLRTRVRYLFYNWQTKAEETVPVGVLVDAVQPSGRVIGAGTCVDDDGTVFVLHGLLPVQARNELPFDYRFTQPADAHVLLDTALDPRAPVIATAPKAEDRRKRHSLPREWRSPGMDSWFLADGPKGRVLWEEMKLRDLSNAILVFHLDDVVLTEQGSTSHALLPKGSRVALLDQLLRPRDVDPKVWNQWREQLDRNYLPAERASFLAGDGFESTTRLVNFERDFFDLKDSHVLPTANSCVGARAAVRDDHPKRQLWDTPPAETARTYDLHLIDSPVEKPYGGADAELWHLLVYIGLHVKVQAGAAIDDADFWNLVWLAEVRWGVGHPAPFGAVAKDYAFAPAGSSAAAPPRRIIRPRFFFGPLPEGKQMLTVSVETQPTIGDVPAPAFVEVASANPPRLMHIKPDFLKPSQQGFGNVAGDSDGFQYADFMLAHELGHVLGLGDDYGDVLSVPPGVSLSGLPLLRFFQHHIMVVETKPFVTDVFATMGRGCLPRLRYYWQFARELNRAAVFQAPLGNVRFLPEYRQLGLVYEIDSAAGDPASVITETMIGRSRALLHPLGDDELGAEAIFGSLVPAPATTTVRSQGLMVVRTRFLFESAAAVVTDNELLTIIDDFLKQLYLPLGAHIVPQLSFWILAKPGPGVTRMPRIFGFFQPLVERAVDKPSIGSDVTVRIVAKTGTRWPLVMLTDQPVELTATDIDLRLLRFALGLDPNASSAITAAELDSALAAPLGPFLGDPSAADGKPTRIASPTP